MDKIHSDIKDMAQKAVEDGKTFLKNLDFSEKSLLDVEGILEMYHINLKGSIIKNLIKKSKRQILLWPGNALDVGKLLY